MALSKFCTIFILLLLLLQLPLMLLAAKMLLTEAVVADAVNVLRLRTANSIIIYKTTSNIKIDKRIRLVFHIRFTFKLNFLFLNFIKWFFQMADIGVASAFFLWQFLICKSHMDHGTLLGPGPKNVLRIKIFNKYMANLLSQFVLCLCRRLQKRGEGWERRLHVRSSDGGRRRRRLDRSMDGAQKDGQGQGQERGEGEGHAPAAARKRDSGRDWTVGRTV
jgi:hypothetical protein